MPLYNQSKTHEIPIVVCIILKAIYFTCRVLIIFHAILKKGVSIKFAWPWFTFFFGIVPPFTMILNRYPYRNQTKTKPYKIVCKLLKQVFWHIWITPYILCLDVLYYKKKYIERHYTQDRTNNLRISFKLSILTDHWKWRQSKINRKYSIDTEVEALCFISRYII